MFVLNSQYFSPIWMPIELLYFVLGMIAQDLTSTSIGNKSFRWEQCPPLILTIQSSMVRS